MSTDSIADRSRSVRGDGCPTACYVNVGATERLLSVAGAVGLLSYGVKREPLSQVLCLAASAGLLYRGLTGNCKLYEVIGADTSCSNSHPNAAVRNKKGVHVIEAMTILQPVEQVYAIWKDFANLPKYLRHIESVQILDEQRSRWKIKSPAGDLQWDAEIIEAKMSEVISWKTSGQADVSSAGSVRFTALPALGGTEIVVNLRYDAVGDNLSSWFSSFFNGSAENVIREDLRRFKQLVETGETATINGQPSGR